MTTITSEQDVKLAKNDVTTLWSRNWQPPTPKPVSQAYERGDAERGWRRWTEYLAQRSKRKLTKLTSGKKSAVLWAVPADLPGGDSDQLIQALHKAVRGKRAASEIDEQIAPWLTESAERYLDAAYGLECLAWSYALVPLAQYAPASLWWELLSHLLATAKDAAALDVEERPFEHCLFACELPLVLAHQLPELKDCAALARPARRSLNLALDQLLDGEGCPHARWTPLLPALMAGWTRCRVIGEAMPKGCWNKHSERHYQCVVTQYLRLARGEELPSFGKALVTATWPPMLEIALAMGGDEADLEIADHVLPGRSASPRPRYAWSDVSYSSEWGELAILQSHWSPKNKKLIVAYDQQQTRIELSTAGEQLFSGTWTYDVDVDGQQLTPAADAEWEQIAWESDKDVDFMELEIDLARGLRLQRSFLLSRDDEFLLVADALLGDHPAKLSLTTRLPLTANVDAVVDDEHSEVMLGLPRSTARVLPLALSEWTIDRRKGELRIDDGALELRQTGNRSLFAPLFIDLSRGRRKQQLTWRQLSVGNMRKIEPPEAAVSYRVQIGNEQWLIYRSLTPRENRTVLGQKLMCEMHVSRFLENGDVEELLELE